MPLPHWRASVKERTGMVADINIGGPARARADCIGVRGKLRWVGFQFSSV
jgi:hypothetical protein